jgi:hypothetical protein
MLNYQKVPLVSFGCIEFYPICSLHTAGLFVNTHVINDVHVHVHIL